MDLIIDEIKINERAIDYWSKEMINSISVVYSIGE